MFSIQNAINTIRNGGVVVFPTDTAYGIGCRMDNVHAVDRIFKIKERSKGNPLLVLVDSIKMAEAYVEIPDDVRRKLLDFYWPGGLTVFFRTKKNKVPDIVTAKTDILAVRLPKDKTLQEMIHAVGVPIIATSANKSGKETPYNAGSVDEDIKRQADMVLDGECTYKKESTIVDTTVSPWKIIREGAIAIKI